MRYKLSRNISIHNASEYPGLKLLPQQKTDHYILKDRYEDKEFLINDTTRLFIEKFRDAKSLEELTETIAGETKAPPAAIVPVVTPFFNYIVYRRFIVSASKNEKKSFNRALFNKGKLLGNYRIEEKIDTKKETDIYRATDTVHNQTVLLKLLRRKELRYQQRLEREYHLLKTLNRTGISPKALAIVKDENHIFFSQEFIHGMGISNYMLSRKRFRLQEMIDLCVAIAKSFSLVHKKKIVHGDVHTSNIIITKERHAKVIDFGLALHAETDKNEVIKFGGVYFFMPPERIRKTTHNKFNRKPDMHSDVYQLGIIFYLLLYDKFPYDGITWEELANNIKKAKPVLDNKSAFRFIVPQWLKDIVAKCMAKRSADRYKDGQELYKSLMKNIQQHGGI